MECIITLIIQFITIQMTRNKIQLKFLMLNNASLEIIIGSWLVRFKFSKIHPTFEEKKEKLITVYKNPPKMG